MAIHHSLIIKVQTFSGEGVAHWCPGCDDLHVIRPDGWEWNGNETAPTITPALRFIMSRLDKNGNVSVVVSCHYSLIGGMLRFDTFSSHPLAGRIVPLPYIPMWVTRP